MSIEDKKFKPEPKPFKQNKLASLYRVTDEKNQTYFAKFFIEKKMRQLQIFQSSQYNQTVLSDLSDEIYPQQFLQIKYTYSIPQGFIFVTDVYQTSLDTYMKSKVIDEKQALSIFQYVLKAVYSLYNAGFWHRNIRAQHFVRVGKIWKMESLVFNQDFESALGIQSEYLWNPSYQPPQAYRKTKFTQEQLDQMVVWNLGSLLLDLLLGHHKLKDETILQKFEGQPFSFKAIGVKKSFSKQIQDVLSKMLHSNSKKRMKVDELFSNQFLSLQVSKQNKKRSIPNKKIYISQNSKLSQSLRSERSQQNLIIRDFTKQKGQVEAQYTSIIQKKNKQKLQSSNEMLNTIRKLTADKQNRNSYDDSQIKQTSRFTNPSISQAMQAYKCFYDKCQLLIIASTKLQHIQYQENEVETLLLNKYAIIFVSMMHLNALVQSMNRNKNYLYLNSNVWSEFQSSKQFRGFKQIINYRIQQRKSQIYQIKNKIEKLKYKNIVEQGKIQHFVYEEEFHNCDFERIKQAYRKILKYSYDIITRQYNATKNVELARLGMYITYCMTIDKLYIHQDIQDNFSNYFQWMRIKPNNYVPLNDFQQYLDNAEKKTLVSHSIYILSKYFNV